MATVQLQEPRTEQTYEPKLWEIWEWASKNLRQTKREFRHRGPFGRESFCALGAIQEFYGNRGNYTDASRGTFKLMKKGKWRKFFLDE